MRKHHDSLADSFIVGVYRCGNSNANHLRLGVIAAGLKRKGVIRAVAGHVD